MMTNEERRAKIAELVEIANKFNDLANLEDDLHDEFEGTELEAQLGRLAKIEDRLVSRKETIESDIGTTLYDLRNARLNAFEMMYGA